MSGQANALIAAPPALAVAIAPPPTPSIAVPTPAAVAIAQAPAPGVSMIYATFVVPVVYGAETQPPESSPHPHGDHHDPIASGTEMLVLIVVFVLIGRKVVTIASRASVWRSD
jgi:hypothetical protein